MSTDIARLRQDVSSAQQEFALVELWKQADGELFVKVALQSSVGQAYMASIYLENYPTQMPRVMIDRPALAPLSPHRYQGGHICFLHPSMWNPGCHDIAFVIRRTSKWIHKYEVWRAQERWPGAQIRH